MSEWPTNGAYHDAKPWVRYEVFIVLERGTWPVTVLLNADQAATYLNQFGGPEDRKVFRATLTLGAELSLLPEVPPAARLVEKGPDDADG